MLGIAEGGGWVAAVGGVAGADAVVDEADGCVGGLGDVGPAGALELVAEDIVAWGVVGGGGGWCGVRGEGVWEG